MILDNRCLTAPERTLTNIALVRGRFSSLHAWAWASPEMAPKLRMALARLSTPTKRRQAIFVRSVDEAGMDWYTIDLAAAREYVESKRPKRMAKA